MLCGGFGVLNGVFFSTRFVNWPGDLKACAAVMAGCDAGFALMCLGDAVDNRQPQAVTTGLPISALIQTVKCLENMVCMLFGDADPVIGNREYVVVYGFTKCDINVILGEFFGIG